MAVNFIKKISFEYLILRIIVIIQQKSKWPHETVNGRSHLIRRAKVISFLKTFNFEWGFIWTSKNIF